MKATYKFTTDGKKVVVIGDLNQTEKIVQEIFVTNDGDEIPQGERFVVKNLLDEPAKSWKEKELERLENQYEKDKNAWDLKIKNLNQEKRNAYDSLSARVKWLKNVAKQPIEDDLKKVINQISYFLSDTEKWVFVRNYSDWHLEKFNEEGVNSLIDRLEGRYGVRQFDSMRLLSLFGNSNGSLTFRINDYCDGSGSNKDVEFFKSKDDALVFIQNEFDKIEKYNYTHLEIANKFSLNLDTKKLRVYNEERRSKLKKEIEEAEERLNSLNTNLNAI